MVTTNETIMDRVRRGGAVLTDGAVETRVMFRADVRMDPDVQVAALVGDPAGRSVRHEVFRGVRGRRGVTRRADRRRYADVPGERAVPSRPASAATRWSA